MTLEVSERVTVRFTTPRSRSNRCRNSGASFARRRNGREAKAALNQAGERLLDKLMLSLFARRQLILDLLRVRLPPNLPPRTARDRKGHDSQDHRPRRSPHNPLHLISSFRLAPQNRNSQASTHSSQ